MTPMERSALAALINDIEDANGWTDPMVTANAAERGFKLTKSDISDYRRKGMATLVPDKIKGLAAGLRIRPYLVAIAVLRDKGIDFPTDSTTPEEALMADIAISDRERELILGALERARRATPPKRPSRRKD